MDAGCHEGQGDTLTAAIICGSTSWLGERAVGLNPFQEVLEGQIP